jgi:hypothetical protein
VFLVAGLEFQLEFGPRLSTFPTRAFKDIIGMTGFAFGVFWGHIDACAGDDDSKTAHA